jgi:hypothetical protein
MSVQSYPWTASVFKGEGRFLITTLVEHIGGYKTHADEVTIVSETEDDLVDKLGNKILSRIKAVENSPLYVGKPKQFWKNGSKYKGYITFWKHNLLTYVDLYEDGSYKVCATEKCREKKGGYYGCIKSINATAEEIGNAIIDVFKAAEEYYEQNPMEY